MANDSPLGNTWFYKSRIGDFSLRMAIAGVVLPGFLAVLLITLRKVVSIDALLANAVCFILCANFELVALGFGITRRRTPTGRAALIVSSVVLMMIAGVVTFFFVAHPQRM